MRISQLHSEIKYPFSFTLTVKPLHMINLVSFFLSIGIQKNTVFIYIFLEYLALNDIIYGPSAS